MDDYHLNAINDCIRLARNGLVILDRSWLSELVYSEVFRSGTNFPDLAREAHTLLSQANATYVLCCPLLKEEYLANFEKTKSLRTEMFTSMEKCYDAFTYLAFNYWTGCIGICHILRTSTLPKRWRRLTTLCASIISCRLCAILFQTRTMPTSCLQLSKI